MARPRHSEDGIATTERVLAAARAEFGAKGFDRARLADIAAEAGISRPSLLYHFETKDALYAAVVRGAFATLGAAVAEALSVEGSFEARIEDAAETFVAFLDANPEVPSILLRETVDGRGPGREILIEAAVPVLDAVCAFAAAHGRGVVGAGVPIRVALMHLTSSLLFRAASGPLIEPLWGSTDHYARAMARSIIARS